MKTANCLFISMCLAVPCLCGCGIQSTQTFQLPAQTPNLKIDQPLSGFEVPADEPAGDAKVQFGVAVDPPNAAPGSLVTVGVRARISPTWHIYAMDKPTGVNSPTSIQLTLPSGLEEVGDWSTPESHLFAEDTNGYEGDVTFRRFVRVKDDASGPQEIALEIGFQTCTESSCMPPAKMSASTTVTVQ